MNTTPIQPYTETFRARMSGIEICMLYSFMIRRISSDLATSELSFLMGYPDDYIRKREELTLKGFELHDLPKLARATNGMIKGLILRDPAVKSSDCQLIRTTKRETIEYSFLICKDDQATSEQFRLFEENREYTDTLYSGSIGIAERESDTILSMLFEGEFFHSNKTPLEIYRRCEGISSLDHLGPVHVQNALLRLTAKKGYPKLKRIISKDFECTYRKEFGRNPKLSEE